jgi:hypothetical protein
VVEAAATNAMSAKPVVPVERIELPTFGLQNRLACRFPVSSYALFA